MKPLVLCILDGVGIKKDSYGNALSKAKTPNFDYLIKNYPNSLLEASGKYVGLPEGQMGNSEVGHINIGTGRAVKQSIDIITEAIKNNKLKENKELNSLINHVKNNNSSLHICGLISNGGVHSHIKHLLGLIDYLKDKKINIHYHLFTDGRDTTPYESLKFIHVLQDKIEETKCGQIATISGRYYAMDRDNRWDRIKKTYDEMTNITKTYKIDEKIKENYNRGISDEFIVPFSSSDGIVKENDGILVFNFRPDRIRELFCAFTNPDFKSFKRKLIPNLKVVTMMPVDKSVISSNMFSHTKIGNYLGKIFEENNLKQLRIAETEKYAHVTYFFDGENKEHLKNCDQILIPSKKVATYDLEPQMSANEITDKLLEIIQNYDIIILNYANGDMVGHTGNLEATIKGLETIDNCLGKLYKKILELNGLLIITADHGNCDTMLDQNGNQLTAHSLSKVPLIITDKNIKIKNGKLSDIAPTILNILNIQVPNEMTGDNLIIK